ncbi:2-amino-4-hydroxy-6-hydroxymethyldihydropteridinediphosphokinase [soil metagenome]
MAIVYLALGSNIGIGNQQLNQTITLLQEQLSNISCAPHYASTAVGYTDQPDFINTVIRAETTMNPHDLLAYTQNIEQAIGRIRRFRWGPREIDVDIIFYDDQIIDTAELVVPHPRFADRDFVLKPLCDLNPGLIDPVSHKTVQELYNQLPEGNLSIIN